MPGKFPVELHSGWDHVGITNNAPQRQPNATRTSDLNIAPPVGNLNYRAIRAAPDRGSIVSAALDRCADRHAA